jgi:shikimate dehydrogenase
MADQNSFGIAGLLGWPVAHSRSPVIHNHWLAHHGIAVDDLARKIGAVNTVVVEQDGTLTGFNNDGNGFIQSLRDVNPKWRPDSGPILVLGAGGAARAVAASLAAQGANEIRVANRTIAKAQEIADAVGTMVKVVPWEQREAALEDVAMLANATSLGSAGKAPLEISLDRLPKTAVVGDLIYVPPETPLLAAARTRGNITVNGLGLLLNQARPAFNAWFGVMPEITPALRQAIAATF